MKWLVKMVDWFLRETWWRRYYKRITLDEKTTETKSPKFKVGDWVVWDNKITCYIDKVYHGKFDYTLSMNDKANTLDWLKSIKQRLS